MIVQIVNRDGTNHSYRLGGADGERIVGTGVADMVCLQSHDKAGNVVSVTLEAKDIEAIRSVMKLHDRLVSP